MYEGTDVEYCLHQLVSVHNLSTSWVFSALYESMLLYQRFYDNDVCLNHMFYCGYMYKVFKLVCK